MALVTPGREICNNTVRYLIRSKDRVNPPATVYGNSTGYYNNSTADFTLLFNPQIDQNVAEFWVKITNISIPATPLTMARMASQSVIGTVATNDNFLQFVLDTSSYVDLCCSFQQAQTVDSENGIAEKTRSDQTFAILPYDSKTDGIGKLNSNNSSQWIRCRNNQMSSMQFKLFNDAGMQLNCRESTGNTISSATKTISSVNISTPGNYQQMVLNVASGGTTFKRGDRLNYNSAGDLSTILIGEVTVLSSTSTTITIGFQNQAISATQVTSLNGGTISATFNVNTNLSYPLNDWSMELILTTTNPYEKRLI